MGRHAGDVLEDPKEMERAQPSLPREVDKRLRRVTMALHHPHRSDHSRLGGRRHAFCSDHAIAVESCGLHGEPNAQFFPRDVIGSTQQRRAGSCDKR